jgi:hypothetical protein
MPRIPSIPSVLSAPTVRCCQTWHKGADTTNTDKILYKQTNYFRARHSYKAKNIPNYLIELDQKVEQRKTHYILGEAISFFNYFSITIIRFNYVKYEFLHCALFKIFSSFWCLVTARLKLYKSIKTDMTDWGCRQFPMKLSKNEDSSLSIGFIIGWVTLAVPHVQSHPLAYPGDILRHFETF